MYTLPYPGFVCRNNQVHLVSGFCQRAAFAVEDSHIREVMYG